MQRNIPSAVMCVLTRAASLDDQRAARFLVKIVEKLISTRSKWPNIHDARGTRGHDFFDAKRNALEFDRCRIEVLHRDRERRIGRRMQFGRFLTMIFYRDRQCGTFLGGRADEWKRNGDPK